MLDAETEEDLVDEVSVCVAAEEVILENQLWSLQKSFCFVPEPKEVPTGNVTGEK